MQKNNTRIVDSGKEKEMFVECFSVLGGVCQRTRNKKLRKVAEKYCLNIYVKKNRDGREHALNG